MVMFETVASANAQDISLFKTRLEDNPQDIEALIELGRFYHDEGVEGNDKSVELSIEYLSKALAHDPGNSLARVLRGSGYTLRARDHWSPPKKLDFLKLGGREMDKAVQTDPLNPDVRLVRAANYLQLPRIFGRFETGKADLLQLLSDPQLHSYRKELQGAVYYFAGVLAEKEGNKEESLRLFRKAMQTAPDTRASDLARKKLR